MLGAVRTALFGLGLLVWSSSSLFAQDWSVDRPVGSAAVVERYREVLARDPESEPGLSGLIREYGPRGGLDALVSDYARWVAESPSDAGGYFVLARLRERAEQPREALVAAERAVELGYDTSGAFVLLGRLHGRLGEPERAAADFEQALSRARRESDRVDILRALGDMQLGLGRPDLAVESYRRIAEVAPSDRYLRRELAQILYEAGLREEALEELRRVVDLAGSDTRERADALRDVALLQEELGRYPEAIETWESLRDLTTGDSWLRRSAEDGIVRSYRSWGRLEALLQSLDAQLTRRTRDPFILYNRARILAELGRPEEALAAYRLAVERRGGDRDFELEYANVLTAFGRLETARGVLEGLMERDPGDLEVLTTLADLLVSQELDFDASYLLREHQDRFWDSAPELWELFRLYQRIGDRTAADRVAQRVLELAPEDLRPLLGVAEAAFREGRTEEGEGVLASIRTADDPALLLDMVALLRQYDLTDEAEDVLREGRARFADDERIALEWMRLEQGEGAEAAIQSAREVLLVADDWDVVAEAFDLYRSLLRDAGLLGWAADHFQSVWAANPTDYRKGRLVLLLSIVAGRTEVAARALSTLRSVAPDGLYPDEWVLAALRRWPSPDAMPLLRRLSDADPSGRWRYELIGAQLLQASGRTDEARARLSAIRQEAGERPRVVFEVGEVYLSLPTVEDRQAGCSLMDEALAAEPRNPTFRLGVVDCLTDLGKDAAAFDVAMTGFEVIREVSVADALFDRLIRVVPAGVTPGRVAERLREASSDSGPAFQHWLEDRLENWGGR